MNENPKKIIFVHQAKAAGTSLVEVFKATFGASSVYHDQDNQHLWKMPGWRRDVELLIQPYRRYSERRSFKVIHGHFRSAKYRRAFPEALFMTIYRNPVQQLVSQYHYWMRAYNPSDTNPFRKWTYEARPSLVVFVEKWLEGNDLQDRLNQMRVQDFDFVGITERLEDSIKLLKLQIPELVVNVGTHRANPDKPVEENYMLRKVDEEKLHAMLSPLTLRYEEALRRFDSDWQAGKAQDCTYE
ncbi:MAG: sulfotransferase family 2 domain-containing protein [Nitrosomonadales bacterium]|nr:sulfotransferase family 2 domain-containing protein [Nitrosomonadales bacterium]